MGIVQVAPRFLGLHPLGALQQHAGDDLQAVGDAVLQLLQQDRLLPQKIVLELLVRAGFGDIGHRHHQPDVVPVGKVQLVSIDHDLAGLAALALEVQLVGVDPGIA